MPIDGLGRRVIDTLRRGKEVEYGMLGIEMPEDRSNRLKGAEPGTPAGDAGLVVDDQIISVGGLAVTDWDSLVVAVNHFGPGQQLRLKVLRKGEPVEKTVVLGKYNVARRGDRDVAAGARRGLRVDYPSVVLAPNLPEDFVPGAGGHPGDGPGGRDGHRGHPGLAGRRGGTPSR